MGNSQTNPMGADPRFRQMGQAPQPPQFGRSQPPQVQAQARMSNGMNAYPTMARPPQSNGMQMGGQGMLAQQQAQAMGLPTTGAVEQRPMLQNGMQTGVPGFQNSRTAGPMKPDAQNWRGPYSDQDVAPQPFTGAPNPFPNGRGPYPDRDQLPPWYRGRG